ncbi:MAG: HIT family protein [Bdellovibrio sp. CG10_big_fil_rev_8_21_14_0_10_47_8]|nr:MAG: HIT family protein [Bdellovibrio sp. CG10_big_fil_rev_8_21_14_0_10_47_8]
MASIFTNIIQGELPSYKILEDELTISILTIEPIHLGHTLVIPKLEVNHWFDVPEKDYVQVSLNAQKVAKAIQKATGCPRVLTAAVGFEVQHYHLHLIPAWSMADLSFSKAQKRSDGEMKEIQQKILAAMGSL